MGASHLLLLDEGPTGDDRVIALLAEHASLSGTLYQR